MWRSIGRVILATALFAAIHSTFASRQVKDIAAHWFGRRNRNGWYRVFFILQSILTLMALLVYIARLPDRVIYRMRGLPARLLNLIQAGGLVLAVYAASVVGLPRIIGWASVRDWLRGEVNVQPEPEAQGPRLDGPDDMHVRGPFQWSRHPLNFAPLLILWPMPKMTMRLLAFNLAATIYLVIGSLHEETRLRDAYGSLYTAYEHSHVPFYFPSIIG